MIDSPCHNCECRHSNCHQNCPAYIEYKRKIEKKNEEAAKYRELYRFNVKHNFSMKNLMPNGIKRPKRKKR